MEQLLPDFITKYCNTDQYFEELLLLKEEQKEQAKLFGF